MAVARGVQGGHLPPPQPPGRRKKIDEDYSNWLGIKKNLEQFVYKKLTCDYMFFSVSSFENICMIGDFIALHCCKN